MKKYRGAIFDLDGTLMDTLADIGGSANMVLEEYGCPTHAISAYRQFVGRGFMDLMHRIFPQNTPEEKFPQLLDRMLFYYGEHCLDHSVPYQGIPELLAALAQRNVPVAVNSNKRHLYTEKLVRSAFPAVSFVEIIGEGCGFPRKPQPDAALHIAQTMGLPPCEILYIGDSSTDMDTGRNAGMDTAGCLWGFRTREELAAHDAVYLVNTAEEILKLF